MKVTNHTSQYRSKLTTVLGQVSHYLLTLSKDNYNKLYESPVVEKTSFHLAVINHK